MNLGAAILGALVTKATELPWRDILFGDEESEDFVEEDDNIDVLLELASIQGRLDVISQDVASLRADMDALVKYAMNPVRYEFAVPK